MLNKPTNVSPYNVFVDISEGLDLNFTLNNTVDTLSVDIYKDDNSFVGGGLIDNTSLKRDFSYTVPEVALNDITNGNNYYWKTRYWKTPLEENKKGESCLNYWNEKDGIVGLYPSLLPVDFAIGDSEERAILNNVGEIVTTTNGSLRNCRLSYSGEAPYLRFETSWQVSKGFTGNDILGSIDVSKDSYLYFDNGESFAYVPIIGIGTYKHDDINYVEFVSSVIYISGESYEPEKVAGSLRDVVDSLFKGATCRCFNFRDISESFEFSVGDYIKLSSHNGFNVCKIQSISQEVCNYVPTIKLSLSSGIDIGLNIPENIGLFQEDITASIYGKAEYNESPPYYFSCRDTPTITFNEIASDCPHINITANLGALYDTGYYSYKLYRFGDNQNWDLVWESPKHASVYVQENGTYNLETETYRGVTPNNIYKVVLVGQTSEGMEYKAETEISAVASPSVSSPLVTDKDFVSFDNELGCVVIDNSLFFSETENNELHVYRYDIERDNLEFVSSTSYNVNAVENDGVFSKQTKLYDFNITNEGRYRYYAFMFDGDVDYCCYISDDITPRWSGVYITDLECIDSQTYTPNLNDSWFINLNYTSSDVTHNYQVNHPLGINQKYPKAIRGSSDYKTGSVTGLLGKVSCKTGDYVESLLDIDNFEHFCNSGNLKLLRSSMRGENMIVDIDSMSSSEFTQSVTTVRFSYIQIDDIIEKQINIER